MRHSLLILLLITISHWGKGQPGITNDKYLEDFNYFWNTINTEYCYFDKKQTDWKKVKEIYSPLINKVTEKARFVSLLEKALYEIYDHHAILNTNTTLSYRLVPSGTDTWAEYVNGKPIITEVRKGFGSESSGVTAGMEIIAVNDIPVATAVVTLLPASLKNADEEAKSFALRLLLAGDHSRERKFTLRHLGKTLDYFPDKNGMLLENLQYSSDFETGMFGQTGYIKINDCLYNTDMVARFDSVMQVMKNTTSLIIDLRETPSGGNTTVARAILSWFINKDHYYQKHEYPESETNKHIKRSWTEIVSPRKGKNYTRPLVILCDHWTASVGEAIVIGFDALKRPHTTIIGTTMAGLNGAVHTFEMPNTKIRFTIPTERLYHVSGLPREKNKPQIIIDGGLLSSQKNTDVFISEALRYLKKTK